MRLFIQSSAEEDILRQFEWYVERSLPEIARRFRAAANAAIDTLAAKPAAGAPTRTGNPRLAGLRSWRLKGFEQVRIYYLTEPELLTIVRVLHNRRDLGTILDDQEVEEAPSSS